LCNTGTFYGVPATVVDAFGNPGSLSIALPTALLGQAIVAQAITLEPAFCLGLSDPLALTIHAP
jgi:hypothetical protein